MSERYILNSDGTVREEPDLLTWARWFETAERHVAHDHLPNGVRVSTVFLGRDHSFSFEAMQGKPHTPILFETMIFGGPHDQYQDRYATRDEAIAGHAVALKLARNEQTENSGEGPIPSGHAQRDEA